MELRSLFRLYKDNIANVMNNFMIYNVTVSYIHFEQLIKYTFGGILLS